MKSVAPSSPGDIELARVDVDRDDARGLGHLRPDDRCQADAAQAEDGNGSALFHLGGVQHGTDPGGDAAAKQADLLQRGILGIFAREISGSTVYSEKVEQPM